MSAPARPKLLPRTSHQTTRYEVDLLDRPTGQWYLLHQRKSLEGAKKAKLEAERRGYFCRLVVISEIRRLVEDPRPSYCHACETRGIAHPGNCDSSGSLGDMKP